MDGQKKARGGMFVVLGSGFLVAGAGLTGGGRWEKFLVLSSWFLVSNAGRAKEGTGCGGGVTAKAREWPLMGGF